MVVVVALFAFGVIGGGDDEPTPAPNTAASATPGSDSTSAPSDETLTPEATKVAVLNGTTIPGLASREKDTLTDAGFSEIATGNNTDQQRADSSVLYGTRSGARTQARSVARRLDISTVRAARRRHPRPQRGRRRRGDPRPGQGAVAVAPPAGPAARPGRP